jgi:hypothetical protein
MKTKTMRHAVTCLRGITLAVALSLAPATTLWADPVTTAAPPPPSRADLQSAYGHLPLSFEANQGQTDHQVKFLSRGKGYNLFLTSTEAVLALTSPERAMNKGIEAKASRSSRESKQAVLRMSLVGSNPSPAISGLDELPGTVNYFIGKDPHQWRTNVLTYRKVQYENAYPGVDLMFYGHQQQLEYDFIVAPGADPTQITLAFEGADQLEVDRKGDLVLQFGNSEIRLQKPLVYQMVDGAKQHIPGNYRLGSQHQISFQVAAYDSSKPLVIDPTLVYSTYLGGNGTDLGEGIAVDTAGNAYVTGNTNSTNFPTTAGAFQTALGGGTDAFVTKVNSTGTGLVYSTYIGGSGDDTGYGIAVDAAGTATCQA